MKIRVLKNGEVLMERLFVGKEDLLPAAVKESIEHYVVSEELAKAEEISIEHVSA